MKNRINKIFTLVISFVLLLSTNVYAEDTLRLCERSGSLRVFQVIGSMINIAKVAVPIAIILYSSKDFIKAVINGSVDNIKELANTFFRRVVSGMVVFLIPALVYVGLSIANTAAKRDAINTEFSQCNACIVSDENCKSYILAAEAMEAQLAEEEKSKRQSGEKNPVPELKIDQGSSGNSGSSDNSGSSGSGSSGNSNVQTGSHDGYILVGDSRTYGYGEVGALANNQKCYYLGNTQSGNAGRKLKVTDNPSVDNFNDQVLCLANVGGNLGDLKNYQAYIEAYLRQHSDKSYVVLYNFGINDLGNSESYITEYKEQAQSIKSINAKNSVVIISVGPVNFNSGSTSGIKNDQVLEFNDTVKAGIGSEIGWCNTFGRDDSGGIKKADWQKWLEKDNEGVHYGNEGSKTILDYIINNCI